MTNNIQKIVLHIGTPKTGTSSIQQSLFKKRDKLAELGIFYPVIGNMNRHSFLSIPFYSTMVPREFWNRFGKDKQEVDKLAFDFWDQIAKEATEGKHVYHTLLLSGETFAGIDRYEDLSRYLNSKFPSAVVTVVCYIRNPADFYLSDIQQKIKASYKINWPLNKKWSTRLKNWQALGALKLREFDRSSFHNEDICEDFLTQIGISSTDVAEFSIRMLNSSMSAEEIYIIQAFREFCYPDDDDVFKPKSNQLLKLLPRVAMQIDEIYQPRRPRLREEVKCMAIIESFEDTKGLYDTFGFRFRDETFYDLEGATKNLKRFSIETRDVPKIEDVIEIDYLRVKALYSNVLKVLLTYLMKHKVES